MYYQQYRCAYPPEIGSQRPVRLSTFRFDHVNGIGLQPDRAPLILWLFGMLAAEGQRALLLKIQV
jgi:hypothetical protein